MIIRYIIHLSHCTCRCFSEQDLKVNLEFAIQNGWKILRIEKVDDERLAA